MWRLGLAWRRESGEALRNSMHAPFLSSCPGPEQYSEKRAGEVPNAAGDVACDLVVQRDVCGVVCTQRELLMPAGAIKLLEGNY